MNEYQVERDIGRCFTVVTINLPELEVARCATAQEFRALLSQTVSPVLDELVQRWIEMMKPR